MVRFEVIYSDSTGPLSLSLSTLLDLGVWDLSVSFDLGIFGEDFVR